ncbi:hypothetical protein [Enterococcus gilvus]|uniref:hypothetical protein n=1 Tax=Enterococcus gilvus TaxID=160453 RepID=UPI00290998AE|nr:hypothetical protein [Enterococcus gilvus]MDU5510725.1 hypothetical protein [Enterococcus gilvus]
MLNPFINSGLEVALKELFRGNPGTEQVYPATATDVSKERLIVYVSPHQLQFFFVELEQEVLQEIEE